MVRHCQPKAKDQVDRVTVPSICTTIIHRCPELEITVHYEPFDYEYHISQPTSVSFRLVLVLKGFYTSISIIYSMGFLLEWRPQAQVTGPVTGMM